MCDLLVICLIARVLVEQMSMAPRSTDNMNENMEFHGADGRVIETLNDRLVGKAQREW